MTLGTMKSLRFNKRRLQRANSNQNWQFHTIPAYNSILPPTRRNSNTAPSKNRQFLTKPHFCTPHHCMDMGAFTLHLAKINQNHSKIDYFALAVLALDATKLHN